MPLPDTDLTWPPHECKIADRHYREWNAWYSGDPQELRKFYQVNNGFGALIDPKQYPDTANNLLDRISRYFWGSPPEQGAIRDAKLHIPLAGDIASTSADLLFGEPPSFTVVEDLAGAEDTQKRLDKIVGNGMISALLETAETVSAMGGGYLRVLIDTKMSDTPIFDSIPPESAVPKWRSNRLESVTFWRQLADVQGKIYRHLELHEVGFIYHGLFIGSDERLGQRVDLRLHPETEGFAALTDDQDRILTGADTLTAEYIPNMRPNRLLRGSPLGRSDYQGIEPTMDALDETWSSLMRDVRLGKSRLVIPEAYLDSNGPGRGSRFNGERELFTPVKAMPDNEGISIEMVQFNIRVDEHLSTCRSLAAHAVQSAGYSAHSFGEGDLVTSGAPTATEVQARERRSFITRDRKIEYWRHPVARLSKAALQIDKLYYGSDSGDVSELPNLEWPDGVSVDEETMAKTVQMLDAARAISTRTKVQMVHPQWDQEQVDEEIELIDGSEQPEVDADDNALAIDATPGGQAAEDPGVGQPQQPSATQQAANPERGPASNGG